ncbi:hypothetical protein FVE85_6549 [Porphyridium purpureum]|uniref:Uncharacterized protein n=1 Tax=Porphyridium purpureum TaxID=35688 RepID=A0A5J4Z7J4_PORPP|nr:hypothetical protein FVE85_6549 [Porphyridium purpureum]|eukprot:POR9350..scf295_1
MMSFRPREVTATFEIMDFGSDDLGALLLSAASNSKVLSCAEDTSRRPDRASSDSSLPPSYESTVEMSFGQQRELARTRVCFTSLEAKFGCWDSTDGLRTPRRLPKFQPVLTTILEVDNEDDEEEPGAVTENHAVSVSQSQPRCEEPSGAIHRTMS